MDPVRNPFAPGAGSQPPELAGREEIIATADTALQRVLLGRPSQSQMLLGLRGVGKTVLLNKIEQIAEEHGYLTSFIEAPEDRKLVDLLYPKIHQVLRKLSLSEQAKSASYAALRALRDEDFVFLHIEASDEAGHEGDAELKVRTIEALDARVVRPIFEAVSAWECPVSLAILPDHPTPCLLRTHTAAPVPFTIWRSGCHPDMVGAYDEQSARRGRYGHLRGDAFIDLFIHGTE